LGFSFGGKAIRWMPAIFRSLADGWPGLAKVVAEDLPCVPMSWGGQSSVVNSEPYRQTYDLSLLEGSLERWERSAALRWIYGQFYQRVRRHASLEPVLEIGSGIGRIKEFWPDVVTSDLIKTDFVDRAVDAYAIEESGQWGTLVAVDVLHHLCEPFSFFASASRSLLPGGRLIMIEPAATALGGLLYRLCHHEPCDPRLLAPPFCFEPDAAGGFANMGMGQALFQQSEPWTRTRLGELGLEIARIEYHDWIAYFLTGGYSRPLGLPVGLVKGVSIIENRLPGWLRRVVATRMTVVLARSS